MASRRSGSVRKKVGRWLGNLVGQLKHSSRSAMLLSGLLLALLLFAPLPFASVLPRDTAILQALAFLALAVAVGRLARLGELQRLKLPALLLLGLAAWGLVQSLPWPSFMVRLLSPQAHASWTSGEELVGEPAPSLVAPSLAPADSRAVALQLLALLAAFLAAGTAAAERPAQRILLLFFLLGALAQVMLGAEGFLTRNGKIWGQVVAGDGSRMRGTFINSDHFALYAGLAALLATAWIWWSTRKALRERVFDQAIWLIGPPLLLFLIFFAAVAFSGSRAGLLALVFGLMTQGLLLAIHYKRWQILGVVAAALGLGLGGVALFGWQRGFVRFAETSGYEVTLNERLVSYKSSLSLLGDYFATGSGLGTFAQAFPRVQPASLEASWEHAHSDLLEILITAGLPALPLVGLLIYWLGRRFYAVAQDGRRSEDRAIGVAAFGGFAFVAAFSLVDFGMTVPANSFTVAILFGLAAAAHTGGLKPKPRSGLTVFLPRDAPSEPVHGPEKWSEGP
jgi:O-antigen ligase